MDDNYNKNILTQEFIDKLYKTNPEYFIVYDDGCCLLNLGNVFVTVHVNDDTLLLKSFEAKIKRMNIDNFKKKYSIFRNIDTIIKIVKTNTKIYTNTIMQEVRLGAGFF